MRMDTDFSIRINLKANAILQDSIALKMSRSRLPGAALMATVLPEIGVHLENFG
jgi:hypothetical protein